jgi:outer membrane protein OmpA-like peptidoglycan-associated protein
VKAANDVGANFGNILSFTVIAKPTVVAIGTDVSGDVSGDVVGSSTARLMGTVNANGANVTTILFLYGLTNDVSTMTSQATATPSVTAGNISTDVQVNLTSLTANTTYYYILRAVNSVGTSDTTVLSFTTTADAAPTAVLSGPASTSLTDPFTITITFSEVVSGFASTDLTVSKTGGGSIGWTAQTAVNIANGGRIYTVEFRPNSPTTTTLTVAMLANVVTDLASQPNLAAASIEVAVGVVIQAPNIIYSPAIVTSRVGAAFSTMTPTNSGGAVASWSISPSLPGGLAFDTSTGIISGAPSTSQGQTVFTITATNAGGAVTTTVTLTIDVRRTSSGIVPVVPVVPVVPKPEVNPGTLSQYTKAPVAAGSKPINGSIKTVGNRPGRTPVANATASTPIRVIQEIQDALALRALVESKAGEISITPLNGWTGRMSIPIVKIINNQEVEVFIDLEVLPGEPTGGEYKLNTIQETQINWQASVSQIVKYQVELNNRVICEVTTTTCTVRNPIGPNSSIKVTAIGNDNTKSEQLLPSYAPDKRVRAGIVYFAENSALITRSTRNQLNRLVQTLKREGFDDLRLIGHTDGQGGSKNSRSLSNRRATAVQDYLVRSLGTTNAIKVAKKAAGEKKPVATNRTERGQAQNRRTEIWLR